MLDTFLNAVLPRLVQDVLTSLAAVLMGHGFLAADGSQTQGFIGAGFFLVMLVVNYFVMQSHKQTIAANGAAAVGGVLSPLQASNIAKGKIP